DAVRKNLPRQVTYDFGLSPDSPPYAMPEAASFINAPAPSAGWWPDFNGFAADIMPAYTHYPQPALPRQWRRACGPLQFQASSSRLPASRQHRRRDTVASEDVLVYLAVLHDDEQIVARVLEQANVFKRVTAHEQQVGKRAFLNDAEF